MNLWFQLQRTFNLITDRDIYSWLRYFIQQKFKKNNKHDAKINQHENLIQQLISNKVSVNPSWEITLLTNAVLPLDITNEIFPIQLAGIKLAQGSNAKTNLDKIYNTINNFQDYEMTTSFFRFGWALYEVGQNYQLSKNSLEIILNWMENHSNYPHQKTTYTCSERIINLSVLFSRIAQSHSLSEKDLSNFKNILNEDVQFILNNFEYFGEKLTCNHLANNARALIWFGFTTKQIHFVDYGFKIMELEANRIFYDDGTLREGSSHYQLLITRNYLEIQHILEKQNYKEKFDNEFINKISKICQQVLVNDQEIVRFGDISPDSPIEYLLDVPSFQIDGETISRGWASHFKKTIAKTKVEIPSEKVSKELAVIRKNDWQVFAHFNSLGYPYLAGHGHCDSSSPSIFYQGKPVLLDLGRPSYSMDDRIYRTSKLHSCLIVNGQEPEIYPKSLFSDEYLQVRNGLPPSFIVSQNGINFKLFNYAQNNISIEGQFEIIGDEVHLSYSFPKLVPKKLEINFYMLLDSIFTIEFPTFGKVKIDKNFEYEYTSNYQYQEKIKTYNWSVTNNTSSKILFLIKRSKS